MESGSLDMFSCLAVISLKCTAIHHASVRSAFASFQRTPKKPEQPSSMHAVITHILLNKKKYFLIVSMMYCKLIN